MSSGDGLKPECEAMRRGARVLQCLEFRVASEVIVPLSRCILASLRFGPHREWTFGLQKQ